MSFFRTDSQAALNSLVKAARETLDHYRDAPELVKQNYAQLFSDIARQRQDFIYRLEDAIRASGDLPAAPDPDKEAGEMLIHHVAALIKGDYVTDIVEQRIDGEEKLADLVSDAKIIDLESPYMNLLNEFGLHIAETRTRLQSVHAQLLARK